MMKRAIHYILMLTMLVLAVGCIKDDLAAEVLDDNQYVTMQVSSPHFNITRADTIPLSYEDAIHHLDVLIFHDDGGQDSKVHHERIAVDNTQGAVQLKVKRNSFIANERYFV